MRGFLFLLATSAAAAQVAAPPEWQVLHREDFERSDPGVWRHYEDQDGVPWTVRQTPAGRVLAGSGHAFIFPVEGSWADYRLRVRVRLIRGSMHLNYRHLSTRYFVGLAPGSLSLSRTLPPNVHARLATVGADIQLGRWHLVDIVGIGPLVRVYVGETLQIDYRDSDPVLGGGISFECSPGSEVEIDDIELSGPRPAVMPAWVRTGGPPGGVGYDIRVRPDSLDIWYVTDNSSGVSVSRDGGRTWSPSNAGIVSRSGPTGDAIPVFCLTVDPNNPDTLWAGTQNVRGIYKSSDGGRTWLAKDRGVVEKSGITFRGFTVAPGDSRVVYAAGEISSVLWAGESRLGKEYDLTKGVVYKTTDGGESWFDVWRGDNLARYIWIDPRNSDVLYVSTGFWDREAANAEPARGFPGGVGILKSTDAGRTWRVLNQANGLLNLFVGSLFMNPLNPDVLLAGTGHGLYTVNQGVYLTTDGGETWNNVLPREYRNQAAPDRITAVEISLSDPLIAYAASGAAFFRSEDGGRTWKLVAGGIIEKPYWGPPGMGAGAPADFQVDPRDPNRVFVNSYIGGNTVTEDGGRTWKNASQGYTGANQNDVAVDPADFRRVYTIGRLGIFKSDDGGGHWEGVNYDPKNLRAWYPWDRTSGEWYAVAVDPAAPERVLVADEMDANLFLSCDRGREWNIVYRHPEPEYAVDTSFGHRHGFKAIAFAPSNPAIIYAGMCRDRRYLDMGLGGGSFGIFRSADGGLSWGEANDTLTANLNVNVLVVDPRSEDVVYAGTASKGVLRTLNGGRNWTPLNQGLRALDVRALAVDPKNWTVLYAGIEGGGVYKSADAGASWQSVNAGLDPGAVIRDIVVDPTDSKIVYAADLRTGVYRSDDGGKLWVPVNKGLSTRAVKALALSSDGGTLYAATEGEGVFRLDLKPFDR